MCIHMKHHQCLFIQRYFGQRFDLKEKQHHPHLSQNWREGTISNVKSFISARTV